MASSCCEKTEHWYQSKLFKTCLVSVIAILLTPFFKQTAFIWPHFTEFFRLTWWAILLGLFIGGAIDYFVPKVYIESLLAQKKKRTIINAVLIGTLLSTCSHGVLAISIQLYKKGASIASIITLLLAAPWANFPITLLLVRFFGIKGFLIIFSAIVIAIITGFIFQYFEKNGIIETSPHQSKVIQDIDIRADMKKKWAARQFSYDQLKKDIKGTIKGMWTLSQMVLWWFGIAMAMATFISALVPHHFFIQYLNASPMGLFLTLCFATVLEVCSEGTSIIAFELYRNTNAIGNVFVFLMAGVATDYTEIGLLWSTVGRRTALLLPAVTLPQIILFGVVFNRFF
jgi:uncharacterized protein